MTILYSFLIAFGITLTLMPSFISLMRKNNVLDASGGRKIHKGKKVNMGGVIIFIGVLVAILFSLSIFTDNYSIGFLISFIIIMIIIFVVGIRDDMNSLSAKTKLLIELICIFYLIKMGIVINNLYGFWGIYEIPLWLSYVFTFFFYVVILNTYNLIDGIDGQAATQALVILIPLFLFFIFITPNINNPSFTNNTLFWGILCLSIIGALLAFLIYNWEPSKVFMGDTGSMVIGTFIACIMIVAINMKGIYGSEIKVFDLEIKSNIGAVVSLFYIPLVDTLRVFIARIMKGNHPLKPDKSHIHHFFLRTGASHKTTTLITLSFSTITTLICLVLCFIFDDNIIIPILILLFIPYILILKLIVKHRVKKLRKYRTLCQKK